MSGELKNKKLDRLREVCYSIALRTLWDTKTVGVGVIQDHADDLFEEACDQYEIIKNLEGGSIDLVIRAANYLYQVHAIPPKRNDIGWFRDSLRAVLEVACPNFIALEGDARKFLVDMLKGISTVIQLCA